MYCSKILKEHMALVEKIKWMLQPVRFEVLGPQDSTASYASSYLRYFRDASRTKTGEPVDLNCLAVAQLYGAANRLVLIGFEEELREVSFTGAAYTTPAAPFDDRHAFLKVRSQSFAQDAHFFKGKIIGANIYSEQDEPIKELAFSTFYGSHYPPIEVMFWRLHAKVGLDMTPYFGFSVREFSEKPDLS